jgi:hypothetical protein
MTGPELPLGEAAASTGRYVQAWFVFVGPDGELSTDRAAPHVSIGATADGRVRLVVPDGLDVAPDVADHVAARITEASQIARSVSANHARGSDRN